MALIVGADVLGPVPGAATPNPDVLVGGVSVQGTPAVPEPAAFALAGVGVAGITVWRRWARNRAKPGAVAP